MSSQNSDAQKRSFFNEKENQKEGMLITTFHRLSPALIIKGIRKIKEYRNKVFLAQIFVDSLIVSFLISRCRWKPLIAFSCPKQSTSSTMEKDEITRYVDFCFTIRDRLGLRMKCLLHSVVYCRWLRKYGVDARLNFGACKDSDQPNEAETLLGHCWVTIEGQIYPKEKYRLIYSYPP